MRRTGHHVVTRKKILLTMTALASMAGSSPAAAQLTGTGLLGGVTNSTSTIVQSATGTVSSTPLSNPLKPLYGNIDPFYGNIDPFYGNIDPFWGDLNPFYGNLDPFWGDLNPFYGNLDPFYGNLDPFYGNLDPFWGNLDPFYGNLDPFNGIPEWTDVGDFWRDLGFYWKVTNDRWTAAGSYASNPAPFNELGARLGEIVRRSEQFWGAAVSKATGKSFNDGFAAGIFAKYGIDPSKPETLDKLTSAQRSQFFLEWYDTLMNYTGVDHVDHWMRTVNWTPAVTQQQGAGAGSIVGLLDGYAGGDADLADNITYSGGYASAIGAHGAGVASLIVAAHDGKGVMGIAPRASVQMYNPFDATGTASWQDVRKGLVALRSASVINMSLGVQGWTLHPDWAGVFSDSQVALMARSTVFVAAAGNDGKAQTTNIAWNWATDPSFIVVGSIDPSGNMSGFSNQPGTTCLLRNGACEEQNRLMNRFIVAPGELLLVSDGKGGVVRRSGTSFAAPLVAGAITLLHDRWPWLRNYPKETAAIILRSALDLGAAGVDPIYGRGLLDVTASQSPLDFDKLLFGEVKNGLIDLKLAPEVRAGGIKTTWEADGVFFYLLEQIGDTYRDFEVPMSSKLIGTVRSLGGSKEQFQRFISKRLSDWIITGKGFTDVATHAEPAYGSLRVSLSMASPRDYLEFGNQGRAPHSSARISDAGGRFALNIGHGEGAMALTGMPGFGLSDDYSSEGGINPLLGLASGGSFVGADLGISERTTLSFGGTETRYAQSDNVALAEGQRALLRDLDDYRADAFNLRVTHRAGNRVTLTAGYSKLREKNGLLGVQSTAASDFQKGSRTDAATLGISIELPRNLTVAAAATAGRTRSADEGTQTLTTSGGGVLSSAFAIAVTKGGLLGNGDMLRVSLSQPLQIEQGSMKFVSAEIVDRATGEIGQVDRQFDISTDRRLAGELLYASPLFGGSSEAGLFGRLEMSTGRNADVDDFVVGGRLSIGF
jgi:hypothetical protein